MEIFIPLGSSISLHSFQCSGRIRPPRIWNLLYRHRHILRYARRYVEYCMDRRGAIPDYDNSRYRDRCYRNANGSAGYDSLLRSRRMGTPRFFGW